MLLNPGRLRLLTRIFLALLLTLSAMSAAVFWLLQRNPEALAQHYIEQIAASTGLNITVESVNVALLPLPSLAVSNASVEGKNFSFTVAYATLRPDFLALLRGELLPRNITPASRANCPWLSACPFCSLTLPKPTSLLQLRLRQQMAELPQKPPLNLPLPLRQRPAIHRHKMQQSQP